MNKKHLKHWFTMIYLVTVIFSVAAQDYQKSASGIQYKFFKTVKNAPKPVIGDMVTLSMVYTTQTDSVVFDSRKSPTPFNYTIANSTFAADLNHALLMMGKGDSAAFILRTDSFLQKTMRVKSWPAYAFKSPNLKFRIKLISFKPAAEVIKEQIAYMKETGSRSETARKIEMDTLKSYLAKNKITATALPSGLYFISLQEGNGEKPIAGNKVKVDYRGTFLNGKQFDSSYDSGAAFEFKVGTKSVIKGFEEGIKMMKKGGKAKIIVPSSLGYGENAAGDIPPFTTLIFELELLDVK